VVERYKLLLLGSGHNKELSLRAWGEDRERIVKNKDLTPTLLEKMSDGGKKNDHRSV